VTTGCGCEKFLTRGSAEFVEFANEPPGAGGEVAGGADGGAALAIAANAERIEAASGGFAGVLVGAGSIKELGHFAN
jgi:hypothetical protein